MANFSAVAIVETANYNTVTTDPSDASNPNGVAYNVALNFGSPASLGPARAGEERGVFFSTTLIDVDSEPNVAGPHGVWGEVKG